MPNQDELREAASEALALARSMILCGEKMSPQAEAVFDRAKAALAAASSTAEAEGPDRLYSAPKAVAERYLTDAVFHAEVYATWQALQARGKEGFYWIDTVATILDARLPPSPASSVDTEPPRCEATLAGQQCDLPASHPGDHKVYTDRGGGAHSWVPVDTEPSEARAALLAARAVKEGE